MWTLVYMGANKEMTDNICAMLKQNEIIFRLRKSAKGDECNNVCYEILVPDAEVYKAQELILELEIN